MLITFSWNLPPQRRWFPEDPSSPAKSSRWLPHDKQLQNAKSSRLCYLNLNLSCRTSICWGIIPRKKWNPIFNFHSVISRRMRSFASSHSSTERISRRSPALPRNSLLSALTTNGSGFSSAPADGAPVRKSRNGVAARSPTRASSTC